MKRLEDIKSSFFIYFCHLRTLPPCLVIFRAEVCRLQYLHSTAHAKVGNYHRRSISNSGPPGISRWRWNAREGYSPLNAFPEFSFKNVVIPGVSSRAILVPVHLC